MTPEILRARRAVRLAAAGALLLGLATATQAAAQAGGGEAALRQACAADVKTLCPGIQPGGGRLKECLMAHREKVSLGCKEALMEAKAAKSAGKPATP